MTQAQWPVPENAQELLTPALLFDRDKIYDNIKRTIALAGEAGRLWVHVKTHKTREIIRMAQDMGITRFKAATLSEAKLLSECEAEHILLAYPLAGPAVRAYCLMAKKYPSSRFYAIGDDIGLLAVLCKECRELSVRIPYLADINVGTRRTGVKQEGLEAFVKEASKRTGQMPAGIHCYDGHLGAEDEKGRYQAVLEYTLKLEEQLAALAREGYYLPIRVMGGSPTMCCHAGLTHSFLSPGTTFLWDAGYASRFPELPFEPAAAVLTRVVSRPEEDLFTLDLGYKGIASDPPESRGALVGMPYARPLFQNEEHWTFRMEKGHEAKCPRPGTLFCVIPAHICPTCALYDRAEVVRGGRIEESWTIAARDRYHG